MGNVNPIKFTEKNNVHILEYFPGHFGDYISSIISHSVKLFYSDDEYDSLWKPINYNDAIYRKKYARTLRGNGWEFVENYGDYHIDRFVHTEFRSLYEQKPMRYLFNLHPLLTECEVLNDNDFRLKLRTLTNKFNNVQIRYLYVENLLDTVVNEYYTGPGSLWDSKNKNIENLKSIVRNHKIIKHYTKILKKELEDKIITVPTIFSLTPEHIMCYGSVDVEKFSTFSKEFEVKKLENLRYKKYNLIDFLKNNNHRDLLDEFNGYT